MRYWEPSKSARRWETAANVTMLMGALTAIIMLLVCACSNSVKRSTSGVAKPKNVWCFWSVVTGGERVGLCSESRATCAKWEGKAAEDGKLLNLVDVGECAYEEIK